MLQRRYFPRRALVILVCVALIIASHGTALAQNGTDDRAESSWPQFLGPSRDGTSDETGLSDAWPEEGPREVWRTAAGVGMSGCSIVAGRLFTMYQDDEDQRVVALNALNGELLWSTRVAPAFHNPMGHGPRATPTVVGNRVFVFTGEGVLASLEAESGAIQWSRNLVEELGGEVADYGMASSPLVVDSHVIVVAGAPGALVVACDVRNGATAWTSGEGPAGYSSPVRTTLDGGEQVVVFAGRALEAVDAADGSPLWRYPFVTDFACNIANPLEIDGDLFLSAGENQGCVLLEIASGTLSEKWSSRGRDSVMRNEWQTSVLVDDHLYGFDNMGSAGPITNLNCVDPETGELLWQERRFGKGNLIAADGKLFMTMMSGEIVAAEASPESYQELGRAPVLGPTRHAPALCGGLLYVRDDQEIVCLDVRAKSE